MSELETFLDEAPVETPEETPTETPVEPAEPEVAPELTGEEQAESTAETPKEGSTAEPEKDSTIPIAALLDEREKRQQRDKRIEELESKLNELNSTPEAAPDVLDDQEGFVGHFEAKLKQARHEDRILMSQNFMRLLHDDYDQMEEKFAGLVQSNPALAAQLNAAEMPAKFAYDTAKAAIEAEQLSDPAYKDKLKADMRAEILKELEVEKGEAEKKAEAEAKLEAALTPSLANQRAAGAATGEAVIADPLETTFNR